MQFKKTSPILARDCRCFFKRLLLSLLCLTLVGVTYAQVPAKQDEFFHFAPDAFVTSRKHESGADLITIRMRAPGYPTALLQEQCLKFGQLLGTTPRGLYVFGETKDLADPTAGTTATFAVDGFVDRANSRHRFGALIKAFAGAPEPFQTKVFNVVLEGETPTAKTIQSYRHPSDPKLPPKVEVRGDAISGAFSLEYRIKIDSQNADDLVVPDAIGDPVSSDSQQQKKQTSPSWNPIALVLIAIGILGGLLIIFLGRKFAPKAKQPE